MTTLPTLTPQTKPVKHSFFELLPDGRLAFYVDASMMKDFSICESYFQHKHMLNLRTKSYASGVMPFPMAVGSWWSNVMERFYNALRDKRVITQDDIQNYALLAWSECHLDECATSDPDRFNKFGNLAGSVLMLTEYFNTQYSIDTKVWKIVGVEEGFGLKQEIKLGETRSCVVYWIGKPDLVVVENDRLTLVDHKTVDHVDGNTIHQYKPSTQMPGYVYACEELARQLGYSVRVDRCVINICARTRPAENPRSGKPKPRFIRAYPNFSREELVEWKQRVIAQCERLATCIKTNTWNWAETQCHNVYRRDCDFVSLHSTTPSARDTILRANFEQTTPWRPYTTKGDE